MIMTVRAFVMVFGFLVAVTGLLLLIFRTEQAQNKIKVLGQEFEISTPALVVFLVGCGLFVIPLFVQLESFESPIVSFSRSPVVPASNKSNEEGPPLSNKSTSVSSHNEREPNDQITQANLVELGTRVQGNIATEEDRDFFKFKTPSMTKMPGQAPGKLRAILRKRSNIGFYAGLVVYNQAEERVKEDSESGDHTVSFAFDSRPGSYFYVLVKPIGKYYGPYELEVREE